MFSHQVVFALIEAERRMQDKKWGVQDHNNPMWTAILTEEVSEAAAEALHLIKENGIEGKLVGAASIELIQELVQVAAVAVAWIESLLRTNAAEMRDEISAKIAERSKDTLPPMYTA
jgi:hypothetical protein